ncbi:urease accessory protein UreH [Paenibacillus alkalitolerans]|uniref:urease accessory protein UreH n=1 Tax=Paenibacillus alkalitolerans TaxID=2799335 RepID=UPI0018F75BBF|nr:urease accessory protein UreH [Paenibacillus alkalitolerans]
MLELSVLWFGLLLGIRHAMDADHVVAVTTIVSQQRKLIFAALIGAVWGLGHTVTIALIGSLIIYLEWEIAPRIGLSMEFAVGVMIAILGIVSLRSFWKGHTHKKNEAPVTRKTFLKPLIVGLVHGAAGSAAVALLVLHTIADTRVSILYLLVFGLGTVAGMMGATVIIGLPYIFSRSYGIIHRGLGLATSVFGIGFGLLLMYELGVGNGLFTEHPTWTPE